MIAGRTPSSSEMILHSEDEIEESSLAKSSRVSCGKCSLFHHIQEG